MSDHDEQTPLTRRERRLKEMAETGALDLSELSAVEAGSIGEAAPRVAEEPAESEIEISPFNEDGTPRTRREIRELRAQALAELEARRSAAGDGPETVEAEAEPEVEVEAEVEAAAEAEVEAAVEVEAAAEAEAVAEAETEVEAVVESEPEDAVEEAAGTDAVEQASAEPAEGSDAADAGADVAADTEAVIETEAVVEATTGTGGDGSAEQPDFDMLITPPTEAFTVEELRDAERPHAEESGPSAEDPSEASPENAAGGDAGEDAAEAAEEAQGKPRRWFWQRNKGESETDGSSAEDASATADADADAPADAGLEAAAEGAEPAESDDASAEPQDSVTEIAIEAEEVVASDGASDADAGEPVEVAVDGVADAVLDTDAVFAEPAAEIPVPAEAGPGEAETIEVVAVDAPQAEEASAGEASGEGASSSGEAHEDPEKKTSYSFPDIVPPEEWRSVFDDPSSRTVPDAATKPVGDFDDLISRAVADEGSTGGTGAAALILPAMPEDTGGLTGPLGGTGELFVTGSLNVPKSISETGGHVALHDSIESDPIAGIEDPGLGASDGPTPVSARHAVSARSIEGASVVAKPTREKNKLPLILSLTGGGLLVVVVGIGIWAAQTGAFG